LTSPKNTLWFLGNDKKWIKILPARQSLKIKPHSNHPEVVRDERPPPPQIAQQELCEYISSPDLFVLPILTIKQSFGISQKRKIKKPGGIDCP